MRKRHSFKAKIKPAKTRRQPQEASRQEVAGRQEVVDRRSERLKRKNHYRQTGEIT
jgi:hypothetical protein